MRKPDRSWVPLAVAGLVGLALTLIFFYPGAMSPDSQWQIAQARSGEYSDWHPPIMSWIWSFFDRIIPGPFGMLFFQDAMFWGALTLIGRLLFSKRALYGVIFVLGVGFFPPVWALLAVVWKDVGLVASVIASYAVLLYAQEKSSRVALLFSLPFLFYAVALRHNAVIGILPFCFWFALLLLPESKRRATSWKRPAAFGVALLAGIFVLVHAMQGVLVGNRKMYADQCLTTYDLAAITAETGDMVLPDYLKYWVPGLTPEYVKQVLYNPYTTDQLYTWGGPGQRFQATANPAAIDELRSHWLRAVTRHFGAYAHHRALVFVHLLGFSPADKCERIQSGFDSRKLGVGQPDPPVLLRWVLGGLERLKATILFQPWIYLILLLACMGKLVRMWMREKKRKSASLPWTLAPSVLGISAILYTFAFLVIAPACDYRYCWWAIVVALVLLGTLIAEKVKRAKPLA